MTLVTAIIGGLAFGWFFGFTKKTFVVFAPIWLAVLIFQTTVLLADENIPPEDWVYVPVQVVIAGIAVLMVFAGAKLRARFAR